MFDNNPKLKHEVDEVILGNVLSAGLGQNPARIVASKANFKHTIPAYTVNKVCGSGLKSIVLGSQAILLGDADLVVSGGMEGMSNAPYLLNNHRFGVKLANQTIIDSMIHDGLFCSLTEQTMGLTAEKIAKKYKISRKEQDKFALKSHRKAINAIDKGIFDEEIVPFQPTSSEAIFKTDEQPRRNTNLKLLSKLKSVFKHNGTVTAANSSSINDAASIVLLGSKKIVEKHKIKPLAAVRGYDYIGTDPHYMGLGAYYAAKKLLSRYNLKVSDIDLWEINEAFASQAIAVMNLLKVDSKKVNVNGGAIALGHPIGASGARILTTLVYEMKRRGRRYGIATLCIGGGQGIAILVENQNI